jgi:hypothetical protein
VEGNHAAVFAVDEKAQIQALLRTAPMMAGVPEGRSFDYVRHAGWTCSPR